MQTLWSSTLPRSNTCKPFFSKGVASLRQQDFSAPPDSPKLRSELHSRQQKAETTAALSELRSLENGRSQPRVSLEIAVV